MNQTVNRLLSSLTWLLLLAAPALTPAAALAADDTPPPAARPGHYQAHYRFHFLDMHAAEQLAWDQCAGRACQVRWVSGELELDTDAATHEKMARAIVRADAPYTQSFQLTLLAAGRAASGSETEVPKAALKALQDMKDFFPYQSYRVLDIAWLRTTGHAEAHLVGDHGTPYNAELEYTRMGDPATRELLVNHFVIRAGMPLGVHDSAGVPSKVPLEELPRSFEDLIKTTFGMHVGETVVVGTSKLGSSGDSALVVLLTAVP